jgi:hypothetical protein
MKNGPRFRGSTGGWALGWAIAAALTLLARFSSRYYAAATTFLIALAAAGFGLGALVAARAREFESERSAAGLEGVIWGTACLGMLLLWFYWAPAPPPEVLGKPGEVNEVWIDPHQPRESHGRSIYFAPALVRAFETFVWFGVVGGFLSTAARLGRRALRSPLRCVGGGLAWGFAHALAAYPLFISVYLLLYGMASLIGPPAIYIGTAMGGAIGGSLVGAIGESLTHFLVRHHPNG